MTKKDFQIIANAMTMLPNTRQKFDAIYMLCVQFKASYPLFRPSLFITACIDPLTRTDRDVAQVCKLIEKFDPKENPLNK